MKLIDMFNRKFVSPFALLLLGGILLTLPQIAQGKEIKSRIEELESQNASQQVQINELEIQNTNQQDLLDVICAIEPKLCRTPVYNEAVDGDFGGVGDPLAVIELSPGRDKIVGSMTQDPEDGIDRFSVEVPVGHELTGIVVSALEPVGSGGNIFIGDTAETFWSANWKTSNIRVGDDLFVDHADRFDDGFAAPLPAGTYVFDLRTFGDSTALPVYVLEFVVN